MMFLSLLLALFCWFAEKEWLDPLWEDLHKNKAAVKGLACGVACQSEDFIEDVGDDD